MGIVTGATIRRWVQSMGGKVFKGDGYMLILKPDHGLVGFSEWLGSVDLVDGAWQWENGQPVTLETVKKVMNQ